MTFLAQLDDDLVAFFSHDRIFAGELELSRNADGLVPAVSEQFDMTLKFQSGLLIA
jgi:hypothetical protein